MLILFTFTQRVEAQWGHIHRLRLTDGAKPEKDNQYGT